MRPGELKHAVCAGMPLLIPAGCVEYHGNHLPLGTDTIIAEAVVEGVADRVDGVVAPTIDYGPTGYAVSGSRCGTIDVATEGFYPYVKAALAGLLGLRFPHVFVVVHHQDVDDAEAASFRLAQAALFNELFQVRGAGWWGQHKPEAWQQVTIVPTIPLDIRDRVLGDHAGRTETSVIMHLRPESVDLTSLRPGDHWYTWEPGRESCGATASAGERLLRLMIGAVADTLRASLSR